MTCDISGLDIKLLVSVLWANATPSRFFDDNPSVVPPTHVADEEFAKCMKEGYFDYLSGRGLKFALPQDGMANTRAYNAFKYLFTFEEVVAHLRNET